MVATQPISPGQVLGPGAPLDHDLTVIEHLNGSQQCDVYLCRSRSLKRTVAAKVLHRDRWGDIEALQDWMEEGERLAAMDHPNVLAGYGVRLEPVPVVVMEYPGGQTLDNCFLRGNREAFSWEDIFDVAMQVADALTYVHQQGWLHLDLKPRNIHYADGWAVLGDFSIAHRYVPGEELITDAGTEGYMALEQIEEQPLGLYTDVFGLGVVFYQLLTCEKPYPDDLSTVAGAPVHPSDVDPEIPRMVGDVALKAIAMRSIDRYATPQAFKTALETAAGFGGRSGVRSS